MIGFLEGEVIFSDGKEAIIVTASGIGHQLHHHQILPEGGPFAGFVTHIIKESSQELYAHSSLREKKLFELMLSVKGVGPKSAYALISAFPVNQIIEAIILENKKFLSQAPGIGAKAAAQIILDLSTKVKNIKMYSNAGPRKRAARFPGLTSSGGSRELHEAHENGQRNLSNSQDSAEVEYSGEGDDGMDTEVEGEETFNPRILDDTIMACKELGFKEAAVLPLAQRFLQESKIVRSEQLLHLVLKNL